MSDSLPQQADQHIPRRYQLARMLARRWLCWMYRKVRLLCAKALHESGSALVVLNGEANFLHAIALVAALDRRITCILPHDEGQSFWRRQVADWLGMIVMENDESAPQAAMSAAKEILSQGDAVAVFARAGVARSEALSDSCLSVARLAVEAETGRSGGLGLEIRPLYFLGSQDSKARGDLLIYAGAPLAIHPFSSGAAGDASVRTIAVELEDRLTDTPFRLQERDVQYFLADLETVLRTDLSEDWAARPNWKQTTDGFEISRLIVECVEQLNVLDPERLVGLRIELERYREELRQWSLRQAEVEASGVWVGSGLRRGWYWLESIVGFPIALYGLANHLVPTAFLSWRGLIRQIKTSDPGQAWLLRAMVVLGWYFVEVAFCAKWFGRVAAGYYTLTLPLSGLYLWRYYWMLRARTRLLYAATSLAGQREKLRQKRKAFLDELNQIRDAYAGSLQVTK